MCVLFYLAGVKGTSQPYSKVKRSNPAHRKVHFNCFFSYHHIFLRLRARLESYLHAHVANVLTSMLWRDTDGQMSRDIVWCGLIPLPFPLMFRFSPSMCPCLQRSTRVLDVRLLCPHCETTFNRKDSLKDHVKVLSSDFQNQNSCFWNALLYVCSFLYQRVLRLACSTHHMYMMFNIHHLRKLMCETIRCAFLLFLRGRS